MVVIAVILESSRFASFGRSDLGEAMVVLVVMFEFEMIVTPPCWSALELDFIAAVRSLLEFFSWKYFDYEVNKDQKGEIK